MTRRNKWRKLHNGLTLRSGLEQKVAKHLDSKKVKYEYETMVVAYTVPESVHKYTPDFILPNGIVIEVKGRFTAQDRKKMSLVIEQNPDLDIRLLFAVDNTLSKSSKTTYSAWCERRGIVCHVSKDGTIPQEWLDEKKRKKRKPVAG